MKKDKYKKKADKARQVRICEGKKSYKTAAHAYVMGKVYNQDTYKCRECSCYHLTSQRNFRDKWEHTHD